MKLKNSVLGGLVHSSFVIYPAPSNLTYFWNFGVCALVCLLVQIITGIFLAMHYVPDQSLAFLSVEHIMRDVNFGWMLRYLHANGASMFFIVVYAHTFRNLYYGSYAYPRESLWMVGVLLLLFMIVTAFMGYILPWGQMSFWGATVITNLVSALPEVGPIVVQWLWGGYSVSNPTLNRFYSLHFMFPFLITALAVLHVLLLHRFYSNNPLGMEFSGRDSVSFYPYYIYKDFYGTLLFLLFFSLFIFFCPNYLGHPDNYIVADPMVTPTHIVPEWYFLPFYAILRSIPDKLGGVLALGLALVVLAFLPFFARLDVRNFDFKPLSGFLFWFFFFNAFILGWIGGREIIQPYTIIGQCSTFFYFSYVVIVLPVLSRLEATFWAAGGEWKIGIWACKNPLELFNMVHNFSTDCLNYFFGIYSRSPL